MDRPESGGRARATVERFVEQVPGIADAFMHDPATHAALTHTRRTLTAVERAMEAEGVDPEVCQRVLSRAVFGSVDEKRVITDVAQVREQMQRQMHSVHVDAEQLLGRPLTDEERQKLNTPPAER